MSLLRSNKITLLILTVVLTCSGFLISHQLMYKLLVVPQLGDWYHVPYVWWFILLVPVLLAGVYIGSRIRSIIDFGIAVLGSVVTIIVVMDILALLRQPGLSHDIEPGWINFLSLVAKEFFLFSALYGLLYSVLWYIIDIIRNMKQSKHS